MAGCCECDNEPSGVIKCGEFLEWLTNSEHEVHHGVVDEWLYVLVYLGTIPSALPEKKIR